MVVKEGVDDGRCDRLQNSIRLDKLEDECELKRLLNLRSEDDDPFNQMSVEDVGLVMCVYK